MKVCLYSISKIDQDVVITNEKRVAYAEFYLHDSIRAMKKLFKVQLKKDGVPPEEAVKLGILCVKADEQKQSSTNYYELKLTGEGFICEKILFLLSRERGKDDYVPVYESEESIQKIGGKYVFALCKCSAWAINRDKEQQNVKIDVFSTNIEQKVKIATSDFTFKDLITRNTKHIPLRSPINMEELKEVKIKVERCSFIQRYSFLDYALSGLEISMTVGVDFTLSNKNCTQKDSLHFTGGQSNQYLDAITSVGKILENYSTEKRIPLLGFGAKIPQICERRSSHCFALTGDIFSPSVTGLRNLVGTYKKAVKKLKFSGPTHFSKIIEYVNDMIEFEIKNMK